MEWVGAHVGWIGLDWIDDAARRIDIGQRMEGAHAHSPFVHLLSLKMLTSTALLIINVSTIAV